MCRDVKLTVRFSPEEFAYVQDLADRVGLSPSGFIRQLATGIDKKAYVYGKRYEKLQNFVQYLKTDPLFGRSI
jgi:hypothetical protein